MSSTMPRWTTAKNLVWLKGLAGILTLVWLLLLGQAVYGIGWWKEVPLSKSGRVFKQKRLSWRASLPKSFQTTLAEERGMVLESGRPLIRVHSLREVEFKGAGRYHVHRGSLRFAPSDDSNPNRTGRVYTFRAPQPVAAGWLWAGLALVMASHGWLRRVQGIHPTGRKWNRDDRWFAVAIFLGAVVARGAYVWLQPEHTDRFMMAKGMAYSDAFGWLETGLHLSRGEGLVGGFAGQRPLYPVVLAACFLFGTGKLVAAQVLNVVAGAAGAAFFGALMRRHAGAVAGVAGAAFLTVLGSQRHLLHLPMSETLALACVTLALGLLWRGGATKCGRDLLLGGVFFGLANLACPFSLLVLPLAGWVAAASTDGWAKVLGRVTLVAGGSLLILAPWVVRQKIVWGTATISVNSSQMLYATVSPAGRYSPALVAEARAAGVPDGDEVAASRFYSRRFGQEVGRDPLAYVGKVFAGAGRFLTRFRSHDPGLRLTLVMASALMGLVAWWRQGSPGALAAIALAPGLAWGVGDLNAVAWMSLAAVGAFLTRDSGVRRWAALLVCLVLGSSLMDGLTSGSLGERIWSSTEWALLGLALLAMRGFVDWLGRLGGGTETLTQGVAEVPLRVLDAGALVMGGGLAVAATMVIGLSWRGPSESPLPAAPPAAALRESIIHVLDRNPHGPALDPDAPALWAGVVMFEEYRAHLEAGEVVGHWSRAFDRRPEERTVIVARLAGAHSHVTLQVSGDQRGWPNGPVLAVGLWNIDENAPLGHEVRMVETIALIPVSVDSVTGTWAIHHDRMYLCPDTREVRRLVRQADRRP